MNANNEYFLVSEWVKSQLQDYAENRRAPGGFLMSVLENNLSRAVAEADGQNFPAIPQISKWIYNKLPSACWGSPEKVANWLAHEFQIDEQGETKEIKAGLSNVVPATRVAHCPFCAKGVRFFFGGEDSFGLRPHECAHVVAYGQDDVGDHVVTFHRSAEEKGGSK